MFAKIKGKVQLSMGPALFYPQSVGLEFAVSLRDSFP